MKIYLKELLKAKKLEKVEIVKAGGKYIIYINNIYDTLLELDPETLTIKTLKKEKIEWKK